MDNFCELSHTEFECEWQAVEERIFKAGAVAGGEESPFKDSSWRSLPMPRHPFDCPYGYPGEERPEGFPPVEPYFVSYYEPLYQTLAEFGIDQMVVDLGGWHTVKRMGRQIRFIPKSPRGLIVPSTLAAAEAVSEANVVMLPTIKVFSREGSWGLISDWEALAQLGGTPEFIDAFYRNSGGERAVRARYLYFMMDGGGSFPEGSVFGDRYYQTRQVLIDMYEQAGWPLPNRWICWGDEEIDWSWMMDDEGFPPAAPSSARPRRKRPRKTRGGDKPAARRKGV